MVRHRATQEGRTNVVTLLATEYGVDVNVRENDGHTPMHYAAQEGHTSDPIDQTIMIAAVYILFTYFVDYVGSCTHALDQDLEKTYEPKLIGISS